MNTLWLILGTVALVSGVLVLQLAWMINRRDRLRQSVFDNLDNAAESGYEFLSSSPYRIAYELEWYTQDCGSAEEITPYVLEWLERQQNQEQP